MSGAGQDTPAMSGADQALDAGDGMSAANGASEAYKTNSSKMESEYSPEDTESFPARVSSIRLMTRPRQRQRWDDEQILPHTNWGDLFFDLFYVAAAYNLSNIILSDPSREGILYFLALFGPIMAEWFNRMWYDSRFAFSDDPVHRLLEVVHLCFLATAVVHIRTVDVMSNPKEYPDMFAYSLAVTLLSLMNIVRGAEIYFFVDGEASAKHVAKRDVLNFVCQGGFYLAAAVVSGTKYYQNGGTGTTSNPDYTDASDYGDGNGDYRILVGNSADGQDLCYGIVRALSSFAKECGAGARLLAGAADTQDGYGNKETTTTDVPAWLCLGGYLYYTVHNVVMVLFCFPGGGRHKKISVPMNIDFVIHRLGEWTMLLLGESILSLLIVETSLGTNYYITFYAGIISVVLMQYLHFRSQPHHADDHAMRRSKNAGMMFSITMQVYSFALVVVGVSFKMLLSEYTYQEAEEGYRLRRLLEYLKDFAVRSLAGGGGGSKYTTEERQQRVANFFCGSLAIAWVCLDLMILLHQGFRNNAKRCQCQRTKKIAKIGIVFAGIRVGLILFIASLSQYAQEPELVATIGMVSIFAQVLTRISGDMVFPKVKRSKSHGDDDEEKWPNVTHATAKPADANEKDGENGGAV